MFLNEFGTISKTVLPKSGAAAAHHLPAPLSNSRWVGLRNSPLFIRQLLDKGCDKPINIPTTKKGTKYLLFCNAIYYLFLVLFQAVITLTPASRILCHHQ